MTAVTTSSVWATEAEAADAREEAALRADYAAALASGRRCASCGEPIGYCYSLCPNSPDYYSPEREREDSLYNDSLSNDEWFRAAVSQYEAVYGEGSYCS